MRFVDPCSLISRLKRFLGSVHLSVTKVPYGRPVYPPMPLWPQPDRPTLPRKAEKSVSWLLKLLGAYVATNAILCTMLEKSGTLIPVRIFTPYNTRISFEP